MCDEVTIYLQGNVCGQFSYLGEDIPSIIKKKVKELWRKGWGGRQGGGIVKVVLKVHRNNGLQVDRVQSVSEMQFHLTDNSWDAEKR